VSRGTRRLVWSVLGVIVVAVLAVVLWPVQGRESVSAHTRRLASEFRCVDCEGLSVADSSADSARVQRRDIAQRIRRGESDAEIRQAYVDTFGESILLKPANSGVGLLVWALPIVAIGLGAVGLWVALRRWQRQPRLEASDADDALVADHRRDAVDD
jgi:cytochrome c-type biogenesis protein CcmH